MLSFLFLVIYLAVCVVLVFLILIQSSKGTGLAGAFGSGGGSESFLGAASSATVVMKAAVGFAIGFLFLNLAYSFLPRDIPTDSLMGTNMAEEWVSLEEGATQGQEADATADTTGDQ